MDKKQCVCNGCIEKKQAKTEALAGLIAIVLGATGAIIIASVLVGLGTDKAVTQEQIAEAVVHGSVNECIINECKKPVDCHITRSPSRVLCPISESEGIRDASDEAYKACKRTSRDTKACAEDAERLFRVNKELLMRNVEFDFNNCEQGINRLAQIKATEDFKNHNKLYKQTHLCNPGALSCYPVEDFIGRQRGDFN